MAATKAIDQTKKELLFAAWKSIHGEYPSKSTFASQDDLNAFSRYYAILKQLNRIPVSKRKESELKDALFMQKVSPNLAEEIVALLLGNQKIEVDRNFLSKTKPSLPRIREINWRINVVISNNFCSRVFLPVVELILKLSDGRKLNLEFSVQKFHFLRFTVAKLLKEIQQLETRTVIQQALQEKQSL